MDNIGLDLHKRDRQLSIKAEDGTITERRIVTSRERFTAVPGDRTETRTTGESVGHHSCAERMRGKLPGVSSPIVSAM